VNGKLIPLRRVEGQPAELSDEAVLAACGTGDAAALGALFDRFHQDVYRFVGRFPQIDELGRDDLVQQTFLEIRRAAPSYRGASSVRSWILGIAANIARRSHRSERRRWVRQARYLAQPAGPARLVDDDVAQRRLLEAVAAALGRLSRDHQVIFVLCDLEQLPCVEVARLLSIPQGTAWRRLHEARKALRAAVGAEVSDGGKDAP
jgi:RNA polymerase sigma factor (sigma-70 family)